LLVGKISALKDVNVPHPPLAQSASGDSNANSICNRAYRCIWKYLVGISARRRPTGFAGHCFGLTLSRGCATRSP
jgi:hypothetical protein